MAELPEPDAHSALMPVTVRLKYIAENEWGRRRYLGMIKPEEMDELARAEEQEQGDRRGLEWGEASAARINLRKKLGGTRAGAEELPGRDAARRW